MSFWDDISVVIGEVDVDDVLGIFGAVDSVENQDRQVQQQQAAQPEYIAQPTHGTTADGQPILVGSGQLAQSWYQDPVKLGAAALFITGLVIATVVVATRSSK